MRGFKWLTIVVRTGGSRWLPYIAICFWNISFLAVMPSSTSPIHAHAISIHILYKHEWLSHIASGFKPPPKVFL
ncbi:hypothetical protein BKA61DRAFT_622005 [Leptodontidium sp. MPI-SDFR-AT-0119]|nr:hypothetical protein BKA61DRAFT_622005 [Leptodontidium sp. MPI-SDFR-AT-0119]